MEAVDPGGTGVGRIARRLKYVLQISANKTVATKK